MQAELTCKEAGLVKVLGLGQLLGQTASRAIIPSGLGSGTGKGIISLSAQSVGKTKPYQIWYALKKGAILKSHKLNENKDLSKFSCLVCRAILISSLGSVFI